MLRTGEAVRVFSFCLEPISINSILVKLSVSLLAISHLLIFSKSVFKRDGMIFTFHIFISVIKIRIIGIHFRVRVS